MEEVLTLIKSLHEKIDSLQEEINELKTQQRPTSSKDFLTALKDTAGVDFEEWIKTIQISHEDIKELLLNSNRDCKKIDKNYFELLKSINMSDALKVFSNNKNTIYIFTDSRWISMRKENILSFQNKIQEKMRKCFREMTKANSPLLNDNTIKDFSYMEQRNKISQISTVSHTIFKNDLYKMLTNYTN